MPKGVCVLENAEYQVHGVGVGLYWEVEAGPGGGSCLTRPSLCPQPGSPVYSSKCQQCICTNTTDSETQLNLVSCSHVPCNTSCSLVSPGAQPAPREAASPPPLSSPQRRCHVS